MHPRGEVSEGRSGPAGVGGVCKHVTGRRSAGDCDVHIFGDGVCWLAGSAWDRFRGGDGGGCLAATSGHWKDTRTVVVLKDVTWGIVVACWLAVRRAKWPRNENNRVRACQSHVQIQYHIYCPVELFGEAALRCHCPLLARDLGAPTWASRAEESGRSPLLGSIPAPRNWTYADIMQ